MCSLIHDINSLVTIDDLKLPLLLIYYEDLVQAFLILDLWHLKISISIRVHQAVLIDIRIFNNAK